MNRPVVSGLFVALLLAGCNGSEESADQVPMPARTGTLTLETPSEVVFDGKLVQEGRCVGKDDTLSIWSTGDDRSLISVSLKWLKGRFVAESEPGRASFVQLSGPQMDLQDVAARVDSPNGSRGQVSAVFDDGLSDGLQPIEISWRCDDG